MQKANRARSTYRVPTAFLLLLAALLAAIAFWLSEGADPSSSSVPEEPALTHAILESPIPGAIATPWNLVLVNRWNPISTLIEKEIELSALSNGQRVDSRICPDLQRMFDDMRSDGIYPIVVSGYRTQEDQQQIYNDKMAEFTAQGHSASQAQVMTEQWVAVPGTSEHQLGLGVDINADSEHSTGNEVYDWLNANAHRYGFIHRYPADKTEITGVANEPWHYRYVGIEVATEMYNRGICLEEYLENMD